MPRLDYNITKDDISFLKERDATPEPKVIVDIQNTLANALQPVQMPQGEAQVPANANASWGKAAQG